MLLCFSVSGKLLQFYDVFHNRYESQPAVCKHNNIQYVIKWDIRLLYVKLNNIQ